MHGHYKIRKKNLAMWLKAKLACLDWLNRPKGLDWLNLVYCSASVPTLPGACVPADN